MKNCVGFDIGNHALHVAVKKNDKIVRSIVERLAEGMVLNGRITSLDAMSDAIKELRKTRKIRERAASVVLPAGLCYCRRFTVSAMSKEQLVFNLPYEFHDFITDDKRNYFFDYAVIDIIKDEDGTPKEYDLIGAATRKDVIADYTRMFAKAGFKLKAAIPEELAYVNVLRAHGVDPHRHGILDIGHNAVRLYMFTGDRFESVRVIDYGCNALDVVISEKFGVDDHYLSATYRENNYENATELPGCLEIYNAMAIEVLKAVNFYRFNGGGRLEHLHCCGGGVKIEALLNMLRRLPIEITDLSEFIPEPETAADANGAPKTADTGVSAVADNSSATEAIADASGDEVAPQEGVTEDVGEGSSEPVSASSMEEPSQSEDAEGVEDTENTETTEDSENAEEPEETENSETAEEPEETEDSETAEEPEETEDSENAEGSEEPENSETAEDTENTENNEESPLAGEGADESAPRTPENVQPSDGAQPAPSPEDAQKGGKETEAVDYALVIAAAGAALQ